MRNKNFGTYLVFSTIHLFVPKTSFLTLSLYFLFDMSYKSSHLRTNYINFSSIFKTKTGSTRCKQTLEVWWRRLRLFALLESSRHRPFRTRSVTPNILAQQRRRNGTETWRRCSCQCEHLRLITHEQILLHGDVPRRNSVYRPLNVDSLVNITVNDWGQHCSANARSYSLCWSVNAPFTSAYSLETSCCGLGVINAPVSTGTGDRVSRSDFY